MRNKNETRVWKVSLNVWIAAEDRREALDGIHNTMMDVCENSDPIQAYEPKSVKLDYIES